RPESRDRRGARGPPGPAFAYLSLSSAPPPCFASFPRKTKTLARSRDEGSWCHPISARHHWRTLSLRGHGAPLDNGGPPGAPKRASGRRLAGPIRAVSAARVSTSPRFSFGVARPNRSRSSDVPPIVARVSHRRT